MISADGVQRAKQRGLDDFERQINNLKEEQRQVTERGRKKNMDIRQAEKDLADLESQVGKQGHKLQQTSDHSSKVWQWVKQHRDDFEKPVFGPPMVECSLKNPRYADQVESLFQRNSYLTFTVQTDNDFKKLSDQASSMGLSEVNIRTVRFGLDTFQPPCDQDQMKQYGFEGWALDFLQGPEPVLAGLCGEMKLHETGVGLRDTSSQQFDALQKSQITSWVTSKSSYRITRRREYGPGATSTQVKDTRRAQVWTDQPVDLTAKRELQENVEGWTEEINALKRQNEESGAKILEIKRSYQETQGECVRPFYPPVAVLDR